MGPVSDGDSPVGAFGQIPLLLLLLLLLMMLLLMLLLRRRWRRLLLLRYWLGNMEGSRVLVA